jgi:hypothetical protein
MQTFVKGENNQRTMPAAGGKQGLLFPEEGLFFSG